jgi:hypothetical protein
MIGFELNGEGSGGFREKRGAWTEGSLMALKILATAASLANKDQQHKSQRGALSSIELNFKKIADAKFSSICAMGLAFTLFLKGDIQLKYFFDPAKSGAQIQGEFYKALAAQESEIGDQVMIHMCAMIEDFAIMNLGSNADALVLGIDVDL